MEVETISEPKLRKGFFLFLSLVLEEQFSKKYCTFYPNSEKGKNFENSRIYCILNFHDFPWKFPICTQGNRLTALQNISG